jgi:hypothetical protein
MNQYAINKIKETLSNLSKTIQKFSIMNLCFTLLGVLLLVLTFIFYKESHELIIAIISLFFSLLLISYSFSKIAEKVLYWTVHLCSILLGLLLWASVVFLLPPFLFNGEWIFVIITAIFYLFSSKFYLFDSIKALGKKEKKISAYEQLLCIVSFTLILGFIGSIVNYSSCCHM